MLHWARIVGGSTERQLQSLMVPFWGMLLKSLKRAPVQSAPLILDRRLLPHFHPPGTGSRHQGPPGTFLERGWEGVGDSDYRLPAQLTTSVIG